MNFIIYPLIMIWCVLGIAWTLFRIITLPLWSLIEWLTRPRPCLRK